MELAGPSHRHPRPSTSSIRPLLCAHHGCIEAAWPHSTWARVSDQIEDHLDQMLSPDTSLADRQQALFSIEEMLAATDLLTAKGAAWSASRARLMHALVAHLAKVHVHVHHCRTTDFHQHAALEMAICLVILQGLYLADETCRRAAGRRGPMQLLLSLFAWAVESALSMPDNKESQTGTPSSLALLPSHLLDTLLCLTACHQGARRSFHAVGGRQAVEAAVHRTEAAEPSSGRHLTSLKLEQFMVFIDGEQEELEEMAKVELRRQQKTATSRGRGREDTGRTGCRSARSSFGSSCSSSASSGFLASSCTVSDQSPYASCRSSASSGSSGRSVSTEVEEAVPPVSKVDAEQRNIPRSTPPFRLQVEDTCKSPVKKLLPKKPLHIETSRSTPGSGIESTLSPNRLTPPASASIPATPKRSERHLRDLEQFRSAGSGLGGTTACRVVEPRLGTTPQRSPPSPALPASSSSTLAKAAADRSDSGSVAGPASTTTPPFTPRPMRCVPSPAVRRAQARSCSPVKRTSQPGTETARTRLTPESAGLSTGGSLSSASTKEQAGIKVLRSRPLLGSIEAAGRAAGGESGKGNGEAMQKLGRGRRAGGAGPRLSRSASPGAVRR